MEDGEGSGRQPNRKARYRAKKAAQKLAQEAATEAALDRLAGIGIVEPHKIYGDLCLTEKQLALYSYRNRNDPKRKSEFHVIIDAENTVRDIGVPLIYQKIQHQIEQFLCQKFGAACSVTHMTIIGNKMMFLGENDKNQFVPKDVTVEDVLPREATCGFCGRTCREASHALRKPVMYERQTDVADSMLEDVMSEHIRRYGTPCNFVLVTSDGDFAEYVTTATSLGAHVYLAKPSDCSTTLAKAVDRALSFSLASVLAVPYPSSA